MHVGPEVVDPELLGPGFASAGPVVKEKDVCLYALGVEDARGQPQQGVDVAVVEQAFSDGFSCTAFEEHVVGKN